MRLRSAALDDAFLLARAHAAGFEHPWSAAEMADSLTQPGVFGYVAEGAGDPGFVLCRTAADEAEILTITVPPAQRRLGVGRALMSAAIGAARVMGAASLFLEVAVDNQPAIGLYEGLGFARAGVRKGYYRRPGSGSADALVMRLDLNT